VGSNAAFELRSEGVQELLGRIPPWTVRYGISVIGLVVILLLGLSALIRWPDVVAAPGVLTNQNPPRTVVARTAGRLLRASAIEGMQVKEGMPLAVIESTASPQAVDSLRNLFPIMVAFRTEPGDSLPIFPEFTLGEGAAAFSELRTAGQELSTWRTDKYREERNTALGQKIARFKRMISATETQLNWARQRTRNQATEASIDTALAGKGVIAGTEFRRSQNAFLEQQMGLSALDAGVQQQRIAQIDLQSQLRELIHTDAATERALDQRYATALNAMLAFLDNWQLGHELRAPITGTVHLPARLAEQQVVKQGEVLYLIAPADSAFVVEAMLPTSGSGKVKVGQTVYVELEGFPKAEYGRLIGRVTTLGTVANEKGYRAEVALPAGLSTTFLRQLPFRPEMAVRVEVVTNDRSALGRIFSTLRGVAYR